MLIHSGMKHHFCVLFEDAVVLASFGTICVGGAKTDKLLNKFG